MPNANKFKVLVVRVGQAPKVESSAGDLEAFQKLVGGYIQYLPVDGAVDIVCHEEGKLRSLPINRLHNGDFIVGDFVVVRSDADGRTASLTPADIKKYKKQFGI